MNSKVKTIGILVILMAVLGGALLAYTLMTDRASEPNAADAGTGSESTEGSSESRPAATDFEVLDASGNAVTLRMQKGKPVILNFWASWCGPCKNEMDYFQEAYEEYGDKINFMMINQTDGKRETKETCDAYIEEQGYTFPVYYDEGGKAFSHYSAGYIPTTVAITSNTEIITAQFGAMGKGSLKTLIDMTIDK